MVDDDLAHIGESQDLPVPLDDRYRAEFRGARDGLDVADVEALPIVLDEAAGSHDRTLGVLEEAGLERVRRGVHHLLERDVVCGELRRVDADVPLWELLAPDGDLRNTGDPQQAGADLPVGDRRQVDLIHDVGREADLHDAAR